MNTNHDALREALKHKPQVQTTPRPDDTHSCGEFCDRPECVAARGESLAKYRAALEECVEALKLAMHWAGPAMERDMRSPSNSQWMVEKTQAQEDSIYAAITNANQVLEGGGK